MPEQDERASALGNVLGDVVACLAADDRIGSVLNRDFAELPQGASEKCNGPNHPVRIAPDARGASERRRGRARKVAKGDGVDSAQRAESGGEGVIGMLQACRRGHAHEGRELLTRGDASIQIGVKRHDAHAEPNRGVDRGGTGWKLGGARGEGIGRLQVDGMMRDEDVRSSLVSGTDAVLVGIKRDGHARDAS